MGDRCFLTMTFRQSDEEKVNKILAEACRGLGPDCREQKGENVEIMEHEANYGWSDERKRMAKAGIEFVGWHGCGQEYEACEFVSDGREMLELRTDAVGGYLVNVEWNTRKQAAEIDEADLAHTERFFAMQQTVMKMLKMEEKSHAEQGH